MNSSRRHPALEISKIFAVFQTFTAVHLCFCTLIAALSSPLAIALADDAQKFDGYTTSFKGMATTFKVAAYTDNTQKLEQAVSQIEAEVQRLNMVFSDYDPNSELERWVASSDTGAVELSKDLYDILCISEDWYQKSDGAFDPAIGQLTRLWRNHRKARTLPTADEIQFARGHSGWQHVHIDRDAHRIRIDDPEIRIDLGGIAIGYTVDRCCEMLEAAGITTYLLDSGGDIRCGHAPPGREGWKIEVAPIEKGKEPLKFLVVRNCAVTTSGDLFRFIEINGVRHGHTIDPKTGYGVPGPMAVTVIADTCLQVDIVDNVLAIMGTEKGPHFLKTHLPNAEALFVWKTGSQDQTHIQEMPGFEQRGLKSAKTP